MRSHTTCQALKRCRRGMHTKNAVRVHSSAVLQLACVCVASMTATSQASIRGAWVLPKRAVCAAPGTADG